MMTGFSWLAGGRILWDSLKLKLTILTATRSGRNQKPKPETAALTQIWKQRKGLVCPKEGSEVGYKVGIWTHGLGDENNLGINRAETE